MNVCSSPLFRSNFGVEPPFLASIKAIRLVPQSNSGLNVPYAQKDGRINFEFRVIDRASHASRQLHLRDLELSGWLLRPRNLPV